MGSATAKQHHAPAKLSTPEWALSMLKLLESGRPRTFLHSEEPLEELDMSPGGCLRGEVRT